MLWLFCSFISLENQCSNVKAVAHIWSISKFLWMVEGSSPTTITTSSLLISIAYSKIFISIHCSQKKNLDSTWWNIQVLPSSSKKLHSKIDVSRTLKASLSRKLLWTLFVASFLTIFKTKTLHRLWISFFNSSTFGLIFLKSSWSLLAIFLFFSIHTHLYLLIYLNY